MRKGYQCKLFIEEQSEDKIPKLEERINSWLSQNPTIEIAEVVISSPNMQGPDMVLAIFYQESEYL